MNKAQEPGEEALTKPTEHIAGERHLARWLIYAILVAPMIAILSRDLGVGPLGAWVSYAIIATPMIAMLAHREINVDPLLRWVLYTIIALTPILPSRF